jgi:hypothetical protein
MGSERPTSLTPTSRSTIPNTLWVNTLLGGLPKPLNTHGRLTSRPRTSGSKFNSSQEQSIMSEIHVASTPIGHLVRPAASKPRGYSFESRSGQSFADIV